MPEDGDDGLYGNISPGQQTPTGHAGAAHDTASRAADAYTPHDSTAYAQGSNSQETERREAMEYWGQMINPDKSASTKLDALLRGIANYIRNTFSPTDSPDLMPEQLAAFYRHIGANFDVFFIDMTPKDIGCTYTAMYCMHSLQPPPPSSSSPADYYAAPTVPALKTIGFVKWQMIMLLLAPAEHVAFLQTALRICDIRHPVDNSPFPKILPEELFPRTPDPKIKDWYDTVHTALQAKIQGLPSHEEL
ncbi:hypothetical protein EJ06DRAFT_470680, partial [Trichodelitschia bisporula]